MSSWNKRHPAEFADRVIPVTTTNEAINEVTLNVLGAIAAAVIARARWVCSSNQDHDYSSQGSLDDPINPSCSPVISSLLAVLVPWKVLALSPGVWKA